MPRNEDEKELIQIAKPILFNTDMVKAILDGGKTVTRRLPSKRIEEKYLDYEEYVGMVAPPGNTSLTEKQFYEQYPPYRLGDYLYVRETWTKEAGRYYYKADFDSDYLEPCETLSGGYPSECRYYPGCEGCTKTGRKIKWRPSIHMPKEAARIFLKVTGVRAERLQDIMKDPPGPQNQIVREGCKHGCDFIAKWENTVPKAKRSQYGWDANPWVWVIEFERMVQDELQ